MIESYFHSFGIFTPEEIQQVIQLFEKREIAKHEFFIKEGNAVKEVAYIKSGIFRSYFTTTEGNESTYCFRFPHEMMTAYSAFITDGASLENMQALTASEIWVIKKQDIATLEKTNTNWTRFLKIIAEQQYIELEERVFQLQRDTSLQRYNDLLRKQPHYLQQIPLHYLASYLGITPRHLSRIRSGNTL